MDFLPITKFTCPQCGSFRWGSFRNDDKSLTRYCNGIREVGNHARSCGFTWHERDDAKYMRPTGELMPRFLKGGADDARVR